MIASRGSSQTAVYISALNFAGSPDDVLRLGRTGTLEIFVSAVILDEVERVLVRKFRWAEARTREASQAIRGFTTLVDPQER